MCYVYKSTRKKGPVTGLKLAIKKDDKYYSIYTGVEYKVGPVAALEDARDEAGMLLEKSYSESHRQARCTLVLLGAEPQFVNELGHDSVCHLRKSLSMTTVSLEMKVGGVIYDTRDTYAGMTAVGGTEILSIRERPDLDRKIHIRHDLKKLMQYWLKDATNEKA